MQNRSRVGKWIAVMSTNKLNIPSAEILLKQNNQGHLMPTFSQNAFKCCFRLSGVLLKLCWLILGCAKTFYLFGYSRGTYVFLNLLGLF